MKKRKLLRIGLPTLVGIVVIATVLFQVFIGFNPISVQANTEILSIGNELNMLQYSSTSIVSNGNGTYIYTEKWLHSYVTLLFNTVDGDLDVGDYAADGTGTGYYIRIVPVTQGQFIHIGLDFKDIFGVVHSIAGLKQVSIVAGSSAYYNEFLTAQGAIDDWTTTSKYYGDDSNQLPSGDVVRQKSTAISYNTLKTVPNAVEPSRIEQTVTNAIPIEPLNLPNGDGIGFDATSNSGEVDTVSGYSFSHTCGVTANLLVFGDSNCGDLLEYVSAVSYNSTAMTFVRTDQTHDFNYFDFLNTNVFYLYAPTTGSAKTVSVTYNDTNTSGCGGVVSYSGAKQSGQPDSSNENDGSSSDPSVSVSTNVDNCWVFAVGYASASSGNLTCNNTQRWDSVVSSNNSDDSMASDTGGVVHPTGSKSMSWNWSDSNSDYWIISGVSFSPAIGGATYTISNSASTYTLNSDNSGSGIVRPNTLYYSNPNGSTVSPTTGGATDAQCEWTLTNTSTAATDLTCTMTDYSGGGSASTNSNGGSANSPTNGATSYGACSYFSGQASTSWQVIKTSGSTIGYSNLAASTNIKWGFLELTQTHYGTSGTGSTSTLLITATAH
jgi:hypothetical protein